jgi:hypothetical protein
MIKPIQGLKTDADSGSVEKAHGSGLKAQEKGKY